MTDYRISPKQRCDCARKRRTGRFYDGREACLCGNLIVTSLAERAELAQREATVKRVARYAAGDDMEDVSKEQAVALMVRALKKDRTLSMSDLNAVVAETGRLAYGESVRYRLVREARGVLGIAPPNGRPPK